MKALVAFGTRYGSTKDVAEEIADVLRTEGYGADVLDLRNKVKEVGGYDLIVVGSGIIAGSWSKDAQRFLGRKGAEMNTKRVAMFACCSDAFISPEKKDDSRKRYLTDVAQKHGLEPFSSELFGGVIDFDNYGFLVKALMKKVGVKRALEEKGEDPEGSVDLRDWDTIRQWARSLA